MKTKLTILVLSLLLIPALSFGAAPTETYVDPSLDSLSGAGTSGDPYGDLQWALDQMTRDSTDGDRVNVKAGTAEVTTGTLTLATYGTPTATAPLIIQGYTSAEGDEGVGEIDGNGSFGCFAATEDYVTVADMHIHNGGSAVLLNFDNFCSAFRCEINNTSANGMHFDINGEATQCNIHDVGGEGVMGAVRVWFCYFANGTKDFTFAVRPADDCSVYGNMIIIDGSSIGIRVGDGRNFGIHHNSILSSSGTGSGLLITGGHKNGVISNNIVEGFSGVGGDGINFSTHTGNKTIYVNNAFYNNTANESNKPTGKWLVDSDNESLGSSPFAKSGSNTFSNRFIYFAPLDVGDVWAGAYPVGSNRDKGAVQHVDAGGGAVQLIEGGLVK